MACGDYLMLALEAKAIRAGYSHRESLSKGKGGTLRSRRSDEPLSVARSYAGLLSRFPNVVRESPGRNGTCAVDEKELGVLLRIGSLFLSREEREQGCFILREPRRGSNYLPGGWILPSRPTRTPVSGRSVAESHLMRSTAVCSGSGSGMPSPAWRVGRISP